MQCTKWLSLTFDFSGRIDHNITNVQPGKSHRSFNSCNTVIAENTINPGDTESQLTFFQYINSHAIGACTNCINTKKH